MNPDKTPSFKHPIFFIAVFITMVCTVLCAYTESVTIPAINPNASPVPLIHMTDLYQPPCDPDDHWDLATIYALAKMGRIRLLGVVLDEVLPAADGSAPPVSGDPSVQAIAQMNYITGLAVPAVVGSALPFDDAIKPDASLTASSSAAVHFIIDTLKASPDPVAINVIGSCRNAALAILKAPDVFRDKCSAIYLNAGTARPNPDNPSDKEWNVALDAEAYSRILQAPCPIYWLPCFDTMGRFEVARYGSYWRFNQGTILPDLSEPVQNFFLYALTRSTAIAWLAAIRKPIDKEALATQNQSDRNMWCTAGFLHLAGLTISRQGMLTNLDDTPPQDRLYHFLPVAIQQTPDGHIQWTNATPPVNRYILELHVTQTYPEHMTHALHAILASL